MRRKSCVQQARDLSQRGFTLLELMLALVILAIFVGIAIPKFGDPARQELQSHARRLMLVFKLLRSEAILHETTYQLNYDLEQGRYWITGNDRRASVGGFASELGTLAKPVAMGTRVRIADVAFPEFGAKVSGGQAFTTFFPDGNVDKTVIHIATEREAITLYVDPMTSKLLMSPGYHEIPYT